MLKNRTLFGNGHKDCLNMHLHMPSSLLYSRQHFFFKQIHGIYKTASKNYPYGLLHTMDTFGLVPIPTLVISALDHLSSCMTYSLYLAKVFNGECRTFRDPMGYIQTMLL